MVTDTVYDWQQGNLTLEKQRDILEKRREYLLQLMPDDVESCKHTGRLIFCSLFRFAEHFFPPPHFGGYLLV